MNETPPLSDPSQPKNCALAIWSLVLGILAVVLSVVCIGPLFAIPAVICGHVAHSRLQRAGRALTGSGSALVLLESPDFPLNTLRPGWSIEHEHTRLPVPCAPLVARGNSPVAGPRAGSLLAPLLIRRLE